MALISALRQFWVKIDRHILSRHQPSGVVSWRFLFPGNNQLIRQHRAFWQFVHKRGVRRPIWWLIDSFLWLRWLLWYAWIETGQSVKKQGPEVRQREGIGLIEQYFRVLMLAGLHTILPREAYDYRLYRKERRRLLWTYVFSPEVNAYHQWRSQDYGGWDEATSLLRDKVKLTQVLEARGLPVVSILQLVPRGEIPVFSDWLRQFPRLFCKQRHGVRGEGAFIVERSDGAPGYRLQAYRKQGNAPADPADFVRQRMNRDDYLIQPKLENHPLMASISGSDLPVEIRVITRQSKSTVLIDSAFLQIPVRGKKDIDYWLLLPISLKGGVVGRNPQYAAQSIAGVKQEAVLGIIGQRALPGWEIIRKTVLKAHDGVLLGAHAIAWDFLITPDGPRLLEGNSGWGVSSLQILGEGLLTHG